MLLLINQYFPNLGMNLIDTLFSVIVLFIIVRIANNYLLTEEYIALKKKNLSIYLAIMIAGGSTYGLRSLIAILGYFMEFFILLNNVYFFFATMISLFYLFFMLFLRKFEKKLANNKDRKRKLIKRGILIIGTSWVTALIFLSIGLLGIPLGDFLPADILEPDFDVFLLGFEWTI